MLEVFLFLSNTRLNSCLPSRAEHRCLCRSFPRSLNVQPSWAGWDRFGRARGKPCPGDGRMALGKKKKIPLLLPFHAFGPGPQVPQHGEVPPAPGDALCPTASLSPRRDQPWVPLLYGTKIKASLSGSNLEKMQLIF